MEVHDVVKVDDDTSEEGAEVDLNLRTGVEPIHDTKGSGSESLPVFEDYLGDSFEKVGEINLDEEPQTPIEPVPSVPTDETLTRGEQEKGGLRPLLGAQICLGFANC